jgi:predicted dehydrogenase/nucleoside-diphosphate-sugar epimerase
MSRRFVRLPIGQPTVKTPTSTTFRAPRQVGLGSRGLQPLRAAIVGTGYIADFHARAIGGVKGVDLVSVCDANLNSAQSFAAAWGVPAAFDSLEPMLRDERLDCVHVLVPPDRHHSLARTALQSGVHVFVEKPMCVSVEQADELLALARDKRLRLGVNHNMLYAGAYQRLREIVRSGLLGPLDYVCLNHFLELGQIRFGPFDSWMHRTPGNVVLEIGAHLLSALLDLVGTPDELVAVADRNVNLPGGAHVFRRWRVHTTVGRTGVDININIGPGFTQRTISVRGVLGSATVDFDANTCAVDRRTPLSVDLDRYKRSRSVAHQIRSQARETLADYVLSKFKLRRRDNPYQVTFLDSVAAFYAGLRSDVELDSRINGRIGRDTVDCCRRIIQAAGIEATPAPVTRRRNAPGVRPTILVIGASGFIGRELVRQLLAANYSVRAMVRGSGAVLDDFDSSHLEIVRGDVRCEDDVGTALAGIEFVYHLAHVAAKTWQDNLRLDVEPTQLVAEACLAAGVKRLIYTSTIDCYYAGARAGTITEQTPLDRDIGRRNYYARAKAAAESILIEMHRTKQLPIVIFRPGIVIGRGGNPFHWGVGSWVSESICEVWGDGNNTLPFVLVEDVAAALVRGIQVAGIEGRSYNLIDVPLLTARDYLDELQRRSRLKLTVHYRPMWRFYMTDLSKWLVKLAVRHPDRIRIPSFRDWESRTQKAHFDCRRARAELGWVPASDRQRMIDEGIGGSLRSWLAAWQ